MKKRQEDFDSWNEDKKKLEFEESKEKIVKSGEFRRYKEGMNVGNEISKNRYFQRTCLVLKTKLGNGLVCIAPLTTKYHEWLEKYLILVPNYEDFGLKKCYIVLNQIKFVDRKRLIKFVQYPTKKIDVTFIKGIIKSYCEILI